MSSGGVLWNWKRRTGTTVEMPPARDTTRVANSCIGKQPHFHERIADPTPQCTGGNSFAKMAVIVSGSNFFSCSSFSRWSFRCFPSSRGAT